MKQIVFALVVCLGAACGKSQVDQLKEDNAKAVAAAEAEAAAHPPPPPQTLPVGSAKAAEPPAPEPTTPAEVDHARNQAMIDGKDKDVLKYCDLGKLDDKSNPQALLGCTLSACRVKEEGTAQRYAKALPKLLLDQARRVCQTSQINI